MKFFVFFFIFLQLSQVQAFSGTIENIDYLEKLSKLVPTYVTISATQNMGVFCQVNGFRDVNDKATKLDGSTEPKLSPGWESSFYATYDYRYASFLSYFDESMQDQVLGTISDEKKQKALQAAFERIQKNPGALDKDTISSFDGEIESLESYDPDQAKDFTFIKAKAAYLCSDLTLTHIQSCVQNVAKYEQQAHPVEGVNLPSLWKEVIDDPVYMRVFKKVSLSILTQVKNQSIPKARLFDEFKQAFFVERGDWKKAEDSAWKAEGLLATGGANAYRRTEFIGQPIPEMDDLLFVLSNGSLVLDRQSARAGFLYTFPKEINNTCDYGKNYHFWMTAYFAREGFKATQNAEGAASAAYTIEKAYQFATETSGRDPTRAYTEPAFSNYNNNMRLDLSLAAIGAWHGINSLSASPKVLPQKQVEDGIRKTFIGSRALPLRKMKMEDFTFDKPLTIAVLYSNWRIILNPDTSFGYYQKLLGY